MIYTLLLTKKEIREHDLILPNLLTNKGLTTIGFFNINYIHAILIKNRYK